MFTGETAVFEGLGADTEAWVDGGRSVEDTDSTARQTEARLGSDGVGGVTTQICGELF